MRFCASKEDLIRSTPSQLGFFDLTTRYEALNQKGDPLETLAQVVPWEAFRPILANVLRRSKRNKGGRPPFDAIDMFKALVLQALYNLSDDQTEYQIRDRLSFMRFLVLDLDRAFARAVSEKWMQACWSAWDGMEWLAWKYYLHSPLRKSVGDTIRKYLLTRSFQHAFR